MSKIEYHNDLVAFRRKLHQHPEEGWTEFWTTATIVDELKKLDFQVLLGEKVISRENTLGRNEKLVEKAYQDALDSGANPETLKAMDGLTGCAALLETGRPGPTVGFRFDIDCVCVNESSEETHRPAKEGWASKRPGLMHACGHDSHATIGLGLCRWLSENRDRLCGRVKVIFQPAEEGVRGAYAVAASGIVDDIDYFFASHIGVIANSGEVVLDPLDFLCTTKYDVTFEGKPAHAGLDPNGGRNALVAACNAVMQMMAIPRHRDGMTRINIGRLTAGQGRNVIAPNATMLLEVRGQNSEINDYMSEQVRNIVEGTAKSYDVSFKIEKMGEAADIKNDADAIAMLSEVCKGVSGLKNVIEQRSMAGSEDVSLIAKRIQAHGGKSCVFILGTDRPAGHHTFKFDIDENSMDLGVEIYAGLAEKLLCKA